VLKGLAERYGYRTLTFLLAGDARILYERFIERETTAERSQANRAWGEFTLDDYIKTAAALEAFNIGGKIERIDTTDFYEVDYAHHIETARVFLGYEEADFSLF
jgi:hypothetical protein